MPLSGKKSKRDGDKRTSRAMKNMRTINSSSSSSIAIKDLMKSMKEPTKRKKTSGNHSMIKNLAPFSSAFTYVGKKPKNE